VANNSDSRFSKIPPLDGILIKSLTRLFKKFGLTVSKDAPLKATLQARSSSNSLLPTALICLSFLPGPLLRSLSKRPPLVYVHGLLASFVEAADEPGFKDAGPGFLLKGLADPTRGSRVND
jgi:hypothetical protein